MDEKDIKDIYSIFVAFVIVILIYGSSYHEILQIMKILLTTNILITSVNIPSSHMPLYIKIAIAILLIPLIIDVWYDTANISKIAKTQDEELGEILKALVRILVIMIVLLILIFS